MHHRKADGLKIAVTGGAGFIGSHVADVLVARGYEVVCVDNLSRGAISNIQHHVAHERFSFVELDILDVNRLFEAGAGCDAVLHLAAAKIPRYGNAFEMIKLNLEGAHAALELARANSAKFILGSTSDVYGKNPALPFREDGDLVLGPSTGRRWSYAVTKLCDEHLSFAYQDEFGIPVTILRFFGAYGERQYLDWWGGPQGVFMTAIANGQPVEIHGDGEQTRCFIYVRDLAEATVRAIECEQANGEIINVGTDEEISIRGLAAMMLRLSGVSDAPPPRYVPYTDFSTNYEDVRRRIPDMTKLASLLDYTPEVKCEKGLARLWAWYWENVHDGPIRRI